MRLRLPWLTSLTIPRVVTAIGLLLVVGTLPAVGGREPSAQASSAIDECIDFGFGDADGDGFIDCDEFVYGSDPHDPGSTPEDYRLNQRSGTASCSDRLDNDSDGRRDEKDDGCRPIPWIGPFCIDFDVDSCSPSDIDGDGTSDDREGQMGSDPVDALSTPEHGLLDEQSTSFTCTDGIDNDGDGKRDRADRGCRTTCRDFGPREQCSDHDGDGWLKYVEEWLGSDPNDPASTPSSQPVDCIDFDGIDCNLSP